ncbi:hypothetical protein GH714_019907 [Hevea brasiliensis]|uniref:MORF/ORRM1/DAG-like MORF domain-containing protein n=1 Tax=Hevea brasiliensis TaxID=3981 RepID=A0A6A6N5U1_HEVBR|nr:hypothetical protein GH714_019907 [Hevea brasiliensis]
MSLSSSGKQYRVYKEGDEITEDMVLFEGCDFNHWLITVDFPRTRSPHLKRWLLPTSVSAPGTGHQHHYVSRFQAVMTEEESEKFKDVPGVVFVLPDSYIDPQNKEYGGDKYENGVITPRPPPVQYRRGGRFNDRNRNPAQPRYDQQGGPVPNQRGSPNTIKDMQGGRGGPQYNQQGYTQGGGNYGPPQNYPPQQNYGPPGQGDTMPMNNRDYAPGGRDSYQTNRGPYPGTYGQDQRGGQYQGNYSQGQQGNHYPQDQRGFPQGDQRTLGEMAEIILLHQLALMGKVQILAMGRATQSDNTGKDRGEKGIEKRHQSGIRIHNAAFKTMVFFSLRYDFAAIRSN